MPETSISTVLMSSTVRPASWSTYWRMISEEVPEATPTVLPARSAPVSMPWDLLATTQSAWESWSKAKILAWPWMHRECAPWPIWEMSTEPDCMAVISAGPAWNCSVSTVMPTSSK